MMKAMLFVAALAALVSGVLFTHPSTASGEQYLCVTEKSSGFSFDARSGSWNSTTFRIEAKYLIARSREPGYMFQVTKIGDTYSTANCKEGFNEPGYLFCYGVGGEFKFNKKNGRFLNVHSLGYFNVVPGVNNSTDQSSDTPYIEIGKCSPF
jgi:hypothetical protein